MNIHTPLSSQPSLVNTKCQINVRLLQVPSQGSRAEPGSSNSQTLQQPAGATSVSETAASGKDSRAEHALRAWAFSEPAPPLEIKTSRQKLIENSWDAGLGHLPMVGVNMPSGIPRGGSAGGGSSGGGSLSRGLTHASLSMKPPAAPKAKPAPSLESMKEDLMCPITHVGSVKFCAVWKGTLCAVGKIRRQDTEGINAGL